MTGLRKTKRHPQRANRTWQSKNSVLALQPRSVSAGPAAGGNDSIGTPLATPAFSQAVRFFGPMRGLRMA
jgi:hypothetical protein